MLYRRQTDWNTIYNSWFDTIRYRYSGKVILPSVPTTFFTCKRNLQGVVVTENVTGRIGILIMKTRMSPCVSTIANLCLRFMRNTNSFLRRCWICQAITSFGINLKLTMTRTSWIPCRKQNQDLCHQRATNWWTKEAAATIRRIAAAIQLAMRSCHCRMPSKEVCE